MRCLLLILNCFIVMCLSVKGQLILNPYSVSPASEVFDLNALDGKVARYEGDNYSSEVWTDSFGLRDLVKPSSRNAPTSIGSAINGHDVVDFASTSNQVLETSSVLPAFSDFTMYVVYKVDAYQNGLLAGAIENGSAYVNTGFSFQSRTNGMRTTTRDGSANDVFDEVTTNTTDYHVACIKFNSMGAGVSERCTKIDGTIYEQNFLKNSMAGPDQKFKVGSDFMNSSFDGKVAEIIIFSERHDYQTESNVTTLLEEKYGLTFTLTRDIQYEGLVAIDGTTGKRFNGIDAIQDGSVYDFFAGTIEGDLYHLEQTGIGSFTRTELATGIGEISSVASYDWDNDGLKEIITTHKTTGDIKIHKTSTAVTGPYTSVNLLTGKVEAQDILLYDITSDGVPEVFISYQGTNSSNGGIIVMRYTGGDVTTPGNWTTIERLHPAAWWIAGIFDHNGSTILPFSARTNGANSGEVPGLYYFTIPSTYTDAWTETTITSVDTDWLHIRIGDVFAEGDNDLFAINLNEDDVYLYDEGNLFTGTTIAKKPGESGFNIQPLGDLFGDGRTCFINVTTTNGKLYLVRWLSLGGAAADWVYFPLHATSTHPGDDEILLLDVYDEGSPRIIWDDSESTVDGHIYVFKIL